MKKPILAILLAGIWITVSEFLRNELLFKDYWINHYNALGLRFETLPINGLFWTLWSFILAYVVYKLLQKFSIGQTIWLTWLGAFVLMWIAAYNLQVFSWEFLIFDIPLSLLELYLATLIIKKLT